MVELEKVPVEDLVNFLYWIEDMIDCKECDFVKECAQERDGIGCVEFLYDKYKEYEAVINDLWDDLYDDEADWDDDDLIDYVDAWNPDDDDDYISTMNEVFWSDLYDEKIDYEHL